MVPIHVSADILLAGGYSDYEIDTERKLELTFEFREDCDVFVRVKNAGEVRIRGFVHENVRASLLFWNDCAAPVEWDDGFEVMGNADFTAAYCECAAGDVKRNSFVSLRQPGARALVSTASLVASKKNYRMQVVNYAPHTFGDMKNYAVVKEGGNLLIDAVGRIVKGASRSESHQTSRALCFENGQKSEILPELLIDEDDVKASHAMSIGRVDEDQLYYMMSRGLSADACASLISTGYLMPVCDVIDNPELKEQLRAELERKLAV
ncbi:MAG: SufD family Fe-S cluster assembly protein [Solobacterium sp.]|nr:SufD family Fe-S cluster assembly protein [Solobacterium sp.]